MAGEYQGPLARKLPDISVLGADDPDTWQTYHMAAMERHGALFREFGIEPPAPDDTGNPAWRELAIALARRHVPAFGGKRGRPATSREQTLRWFLASQYFQRRDNVTQREADRRVAEHFQEEVGVVLDRLKELRRSSDYRDGGPLLNFVDRIADEIGPSALLVGLAEALGENADFSGWLGQEFDRLSRYPYG